MRKKTSGNVHRQHKHCRVIIDNAIDEALAGICTNVQVTINPEGSLCVSDNGRGISIEAVPPTQISALETVFTKLHAGSKFSEKSYGVSSGLHGVGASVVNALATELWVETSRNGHRYRQSFKKGLRITEVMLIGPSTIEGTAVTFNPDTEVFFEIEENGARKTIEWDREIL